MIERPKTLRRGQRVTNEPAQRRISTTARVGFGVIFIVTLAAAVSLDLLSSSTSFDDAPWAPWLLASMLGSTAMAILVSTEGAIHRSMGSRGTGWLVTAGLVLAVVGVFVLALPVLAVAASLAEGF